MIRQWEILHYPSERDGDRYRLSLWSDGSDVARIRNLYPGRVGAVWIPRRKPYNCAFFVYRLDLDEKSELEDKLSGKTSFPESPLPFVAAKAVNEKLTKEDTQEVVLIDGAAPEGDAVTTGVGATSRAARSVRLGYFIPVYLPDAGSQVHSILERTLYDKKVSVTFENVFSVTYPSLSLSEIHRLIQHCQAKSVMRVIAVGDLAHMHALCKIAGEANIFVKPLSESVLDRNLWLTMVAEIISHE